VNAGVPPPELSSKRLAVAATMDKFLRETVITRNPGTAADYRSKLGAFLKVCKKAYLDEIGDDEVISFVAELNHRNLSARTIENHCIVLNTFLRRYGFKDRVTKRLVPKATDKVVSAYSASELKAIFASAKGEERILFQFFLGLLGSTKANWLRFHHFRMEMNGRASRQRASHCRSGLAIPSLHLDTDFANPLN
jgi:hypothetical protein